MEGTNPLLQDHFHKKFSKLWESMTVGLIKTDFCECSIFPLDLNVMAQVDIPIIHKTHLHHHQSHQIQIHQHLQKKTHL